MARPRPVCTKCEVELTCSTTGVSVVVMAGDRTYEVWHGDAFKCPGCGAEVVVGFGAKPTAREADCAKWLEHSRLIDERIIYDYQKVR